MCDSSGKILVKVGHWPVVMKLASNYERMISQMVFRLSRLFQAAASHSESGDFSRRAKVTTQTIDGLARRCVGLFKVSNCFNLNVFCKSHAKNTEHTCEL